MKRVCFFAVVFTTLFYSISYGATYGGGAGTAENPYQIWTAEQMNTIGVNSGDWGKYFILMADIDLQGIVLTPIGNSSSRYTGSFNGNGHVIRNAVFNTAGYVGLFGYVDTAGRISYLGLESVTATGDYAGGLAGVNYGVIHNCYAAGTITTNWRYAGGLVGANYGIVDQCYADGTVTANATTMDIKVGGLAGYNYGSVNRCYAAGTVVCNSSSTPCYVGGLIGHNFQTSVNQCYATGNVVGYGIGDSCYIGGLIGYNYNGGANQCYATGAVTRDIGIPDTAYVGGLIGRGGGASNCYATGRVGGTTNSYYVGGLAGGDVSISTSYSTGAVITSSSTGGGLIGSTLEATDSFWDTQTSGKSTSGGGTGKTTEQMQTRLTFTDAWWDFVGETTNGTENIWTISAGQYPRLVWQDSAAGAAATVANVTLLTQADAETIITAAGFTVWVTYSYSNTAASGTVISQSPAAGTTFQQGRPVNITVSLGVNYPGSGTQADPYKIGTVTAWKNFMLSSSNWNKYYILIADLDLRYVILTPVGNYTTRFTGSFNGNGHVIRNAMIKISGSDYTGLFGYVGMGGWIFDLGLESVKITGDYNVGGLAGHNTGTISDCDVTCDVSGSQYVGGLLGSNSGTVSHCSTRGRVGGGPYTGGLIGYIYQGTINDCYMACTVTGSAYAGGLAGYNGSGTITRCSSVGVLRTSPMGGLYFGGLAGYNVIGRIEECYSTGAVCRNWAWSSSQFTGGLAGRNESGTIKNCYSSGAVGGTSNYGGFVGNNGGTISQCYSTGFVSAQSLSGGFSGPNTGTITSSFWDMETSGKTLSAGGSGVQGKTTAEMKAMSTFESLGWDFVDETANGTADIWAMRCEGMNYPKLSWQEIPAADFVCPDGVNTEDLGYLAVRWLLEDCNSSNNYCGGADMDSSGAVDLADWAILAVNWLEGI
jgi:hypothetical protein